MNIFGGPRPKVHKAAPVDYVAADAADTRGRMIEQNALVNNLRQAGSLYNEAMGDNTPIADYFADSPSAGPSGGMTKAMNAGDIDLGLPAGPPTPMTTQAPDVGMDAAGSAGTGAGTASSLASGGLVTALMANEMGASRTEDYRNFGPEGYAFNEGMYEDVSQRIPDALGADAGEGWAGVTGDKASGELVQQLLVNPINPMFYIQSLKDLLS